MVWPTRQGHIRQRPPIYVLLRESTCPTIRDQTKCVLSIPPPNGRAIRTDKSVGGTIPPPDHQQRPNRLERLARDSHHGAQQSQKHHHQHRPLGSTPRLHPSATPRGPPSIIEPTHGRQEANCPRKTGPGSRGHQPHSPSNATAPIQGGSRGLARGQEPPTTLPDPQTSPQTTRPLLHQQTSVTGGVSASTTRRLENPQHVPRQPPHALSRDPTARPQLHQTTP
jgi:hypothetical protein